MESLVDGYAPFPLLPIERYSQKHGEKVATISEIEGIVNPVIGELDPGRIYMHTHWHENIRVTLGWNHLMGIAEFYIGRIELEQPNSWRSEFTDVKIVNNWAAMRPYYEWVVKRLRRRFRVIQELTSQESTLKEIRDDVIKIVSETHAGLTGISDTQAAQARAVEHQLPIKPKRGSSVDIWLDYYHAMKKAGYKMTFPMLQKESGYSYNTFKQAHGIYKRNRGIDLPND